MTTPTSNQMPFLMRRHHRLTVTALRMPILSEGAPETVKFACWEGGERIKVTLARRWPHIELARTADGTVFDYVMSRFLHASDQAHGTVVSHVTFNIGTIIRDLRLGTLAATQVIDALRRLTNTLVTLETRKRPLYPKVFPLLEIAKNTDGTFDVGLSAWLEDEVMYARFAPARSNETTLHGIRLRLDGWMRGRVGRGQHDGRIIRRSEALDRIGPLPGVAAGERWNAICAIVEADDLNNFEMSLDTDRGEPAIYIRPRRVAYDEHPDSGDGNPSGGYCEISMDCSDDAARQCHNTVTPPWSVPL